MNKLARFKQLETVSDPAMLGLFEEWLEAIENEVIAFLEGGGDSSPEGVAGGTGLSVSGAGYILDKLKGEERI